MRKQIFKTNLRFTWEIDPETKALMNLVELKVSKHLFEDMMDYLLGFDKEMQLEIANNLMDCVRENCDNYIGIRHIDTKMRCFYLLIDQEMGRKLLVNQRKI